MTSATSNTPTAPCSLYQEHKDQQLGSRSCGYSDGATCSGPYRPGDNPSHSGQSYGSAQDQRLVNTTSHKSPPRSVPQVVQPIYVHNSQCASPPHIREAVINSRTFCDPQTSQRGVSNDAGWWNDGYQVPGRESHSTHEPFEKSGSGPRSTNTHQRSRSIPFEGHPNAKINGKTSTFYYNRETVDHKSEYYKNSRTVYVNGASVEMFLSHTLKDMMSEAGTVESISYLYTNPYLGPSFVT